MKVFQVIPRRMRFARGMASSVELCVSEWVSGSRYRQTTSIVADAEGEPLIDVRVIKLTPAPKLSSWALAFELRRLIKVNGCDVIIKQQHIPTAARIAFFNKATPVILQTHNYIDPPAKGALAPLKNFLRRQELRQLSGVTFVSHATRADFEKQWPTVKLPSAVVSNGFDFSLWNPSKAKENTLLVVGRSMREKGILESAEAVAKILTAHPDWKAVFILSGMNHDPEYDRAIIETLKPFGDRAKIMTSVPYAEVRAISETAAIAIVASRWNEPFGRTALEAHAGGAALISSGSGGLREISGPHAVYLKEVTVDEIVRTTEALINDPNKRAAMAQAAGLYVRERFSIHPEPGNTRPTISQTLDDFLDSVVAARPRS